MEMNSSYRASYSGFDTEAYSDVIGRPMDPDEELDFRSADTHEAQIGGYREDNEDLIPQF